MKETVHILLPVHNRRDVTRRFVSCLCEQTYQNVHLILIDDGSIDGTSEMVSSQFDNLTVLRGNGQLWWAGSLQKGFIWLRENGVADDDIVLIINDDTEFDADFIKIGVDALDSRKRTLLQAQYYSRESGTLIDSGTHVDWAMFTHSQSAPPEQVNCLSTRGLFMRGSDFFEIGGFYPRLLPHYFSDYEFTTRANRKGFQLSTLPSLKLWGDESQTGHHQVAAESLKLTAQKLFSIRSIPNPVVMSSYILLACPWRWKLVNWFRVWKSAFALLYSASKKKSSI